MKNLIIILIFTIVLFFYLHIIYHLKKSNDLDVYEIKTPSKDELEEICNYRQPVLFHYYNNEINNYFNFDNIKLHNQFDINVRNADKNLSDEHELYIPFNTSKLFEIIKTGSTNTYITENNNDFLNESGLIKNIKYNDNLLRPYFMISNKYDLLTGCKFSRTPFRYNLNYRNYFHVVSGNVKIKLSPPNSSKHLNEVKDYDNYEFRTNINLWKPTSNDKLNINKIKIIDVNLSQGQIIYIPNYWWYTFEYDVNTIIINYRYDTYMSLISQCPQLMMYMLQAQNIKINKFNKYNSD